MLSKTFKSAEELGVSEDFYEALTQVYWMLVDEKIPAALFDMSCVGSPRLDTKDHPCGTPGCILGWANAVGKLNFSTRGEAMKGKIDRLFFPGSYYVNTHIDPYRASRSQAAIALHSYLTTGFADWAKAMKA